MAQDGPHDHHATAASNDAPPATVTYTLSPGENENGRSLTGSPVVADASKEKDVVQDVDGGEGSHTNAGGSEGKQSAENVAAVNVANDDNKGKGLVADNGATGAGGERAHIITERERRKRMTNMFNSLQALLPHVPEKSDKATIVGETINYIRVLEDTLAKLEKRKEDLALLRQAEAAAAAAAAAEAGTSMAPPLTAQGMAAMSDFGSLPQQQQQQPLPVAAADPPPVAEEPVGFQTWSGANVVLSVSGDDAYINVCAPRSQGALTLVLSVLDKHGIDVMTIQVASDGARSMFTIHARVTGEGIHHLGENPLSAEDTYKLAVSELMVWLSN